MALRVISIIFILMKDLVAAELMHDTEIAVNHSGCFTAIINYFNRYVPKKSKTVPENPKIVHEKYVSDNEKASVSTASCNNNTAKTVKTVRSSDPMSESSNSLSTQYNREESDENIIASFDRDIELIDDFLFKNLIEGSSSKENTLLATSYEPLSLTLANGIVVERINGYIRAKKLGSCEYDDPFEIVDSGQNSTILRESRSLAAVMDITKKTSSGRSEGKNSVKLGSLLPR